MKAPDLLVITRTIAAAEHYGDDGSCVYRGLVYGNPTWECSCEPAHASRQDAHRCADAYRATLPPIYRTLVPMIVNVNDMDLADVPLEPGSAPSRTHWMREIEEERE